MKKILIILITVCSLLYLVNLSNLPQSLPNCLQLSQATCVISKGLNKPIKLVISPYPIQVEQLNTIKLHSEAAFKVKDAQLIGVNMNMGRTPLNVRLVSDTQTEIELIPASCVDPQMTWQLQLVIEQNGQSVPLKYNFQTQS